jgi:hypothetical protein
VPAPKRGSIGLGRREAGCIYTRRECVATGHNIKETIAEAAKNPRMITEWLAAREEGIKTRVIFSVNIESGEHLRLFVFDETAVQARVNRYSID